MSRLKNKLHEEINDEARKIEKITEEVKAKCIEAVRDRMIDDNSKFDITQCEIDAHNDGINESIEAIQGV